jgi:hypothetical protein
MWRRLVWACAAVAALAALAIPTSLAQPIEVIDYRIVTVYAGIIVTYKDKIFVGTGENHWKGR